MAITICGNCIDFGTYHMEIHPVGININGEFGHFGCGINPSQMMGTLCGYSAGSGSVPAPLEPGFDEYLIEKYSFTSDGSGSGVGQLLGGTQGGGNAGASSDTHGYTYGRAVEIEKFPFATDTNGTNTGELLAGSPVGVEGVNSTTHAYHSMGKNAAPSNYQKFPFSADTNASCVGDVVCTAPCVAAFGSKSDAYFVGGFSPHPPDDPGPYSTPTVCFGLEFIRKFPFASDATMTDHGEFAINLYARTGGNSTEAGYIHGGRDPNNSSSDIDKISFASDTGSSPAPGQLNDGIHSQAATSSDLSTYQTGGRRQQQSPTNCFVDCITKFTYSTEDTNAANVGELTQRTNTAAAHINH